ncbi:glycosyltransferase family 2 protein [Desertivirga xinjiangensis]|uniref:glycosyltransferase family 2 protein n=1 Tax=Desertivirga xinjiangensis TaxID=539206 RepID=UPI00210BA4DC|nr:glycosyltransferase family 2 protein [Pedobacter xinjiangensis]
MTLVSIIVPVYNVSAYIDRCISSILNQSFKEFQLILIDDGSTDDSFSISKKHAQEDKRIVLAGQPNKGVSAARNKGIGLAEGTYICFIDADDWVEPNYLECLIPSTLSNDTQLVISNINYVYKNKTVPASKHNREMLEADRFEPHDFFEANEFVLTNAPVNKLFKTEVIVKNKISFKEDLRNGEDFIFVLEYALQCQKIIFVNDYTYNYRRTGQDSTTLAYNDNFYSDVKKTKDAYFAIIERYEAVTEEERLYQYFRVASKAIFEEGRKGSGKSFIQQYHAIKSILDLEEISLYRNKYRLKETGNDRFFILLRRLMMTNSVLLIMLLLRIRNLKK